MISYTVEMERIDGTWFAAFRGSGFEQLPKAKRFARARKRSNENHDDPRIRPLGVRIVKIEIVEQMK